MNSRKYRILMFTPGFAPLANPEAIVNSKLVLAMLNAGWDVDVISRQYIGNIEYDYGSRWVEPWLPLQTHTHEIEYDTISGAYRIGDTFKSALVMGYPIDGCRWARRAAELGLSMHKRKPYNVIMSRAFPQFAHLPALKMTIKTGIPWIANWNDPWEFMRKTKIDGSLGKNIGLINALFARRSALKATWCTFPSERMMQKMSPYLGLDIMQKCSAIPHASLAINSKHAKKHGDKFQICYTGRIRKEYQDIDIFLQGFAAFVLKNKLEQKASFIFIGIDEAHVESLAAKYGISECVKYLGCLSYETTITKMQESDVLLVIDPQNADGMILTSKLVDYIQTGYPILAITTQNSTTEKMLNDHNAGICVGCEKATDVTQALIKLYNSWEEGNLDTIYGSDKAYHLIAPDTIVAMYGEIFNRIKIKPANN